MVNVQLRADGPRHSTAIGGANHISEVAGFSKQQGTPCSRHSRIKEAVTRTHLLPRSTLSILWGGTEDKPQIESRLRTAGRQAILQVVQAVPNQIPCICLAFIQDRMRFRVLRLRMSKCGPFFYIKSHAAKTISFELGSNRPVSRKEFQKDSVRPVSSGFFGTAELGFQKVQA